MRVRPALVLLSLAAPASAQVAVSFDRTDYGAGNGPASVVARDLDGDSAPDLVYASTGSGAVFVRLNQGDGTFATAVTAATLSGANGVALGHLDGDGLLDLVALSDALDRVALFLGQGDGSFVEAGFVPLVGALVFVTLADLNGDQRDELLVSDADASEIVIGVNAGAAEGAAIFTQLLALDVGEPAPNVAVGELNGDGFADVVASATFYGWGDAFLGGPGLTFAESKLLPSSFGGGPLWVALGDVDGDGLLDLIQPEDDFFCTDIVVWKGQGDGTFGTNLYETLFGVLVALPTVGDFNGDGQLDFAARWGAQDVRGFGGQGQGTFWPSAVSETGPGVTSIAVADFDGDGDDDVVTTNAGTGRLSVLLADSETLSSYNNQLSALSNFPKTHHMALQIGPDHAGELYWVLGSATGTVPGLPVGGFNLPLNFDGYTQFTLLNPNTLILGSLGLLDGAGAGKATWSLPSFTPLNVVGLTLNHAFLVLALPSLAPTFVSSALTLTFV